MIMNYILQVIIIDINEKKAHNIMFYFEDSSKYVMVGVSFVLLKEN